MKSLTIRTVHFPCALSHWCYSDYSSPELLLKDQWQLVQRTPKCIKKTQYIISRKFPALAVSINHTLRSRHWILFSQHRGEKQSTIFRTLHYYFFHPFFFIFSFSNLPGTTFFLQSLRGVFYCMLKDKICIESSNFIWVKIIYKNPKTYFMKLVQTIFPAVGFCSKDHSWEILYKIKIGLDSEKYSTVLISNWEYLHKYLQWKKSYFKTLICKLASSTL